MTNKGTAEIRPKEHYELLKDYSESKGISMSESIAEMQRDIEILKAQSLTTISDNTVLLCGQLDKLAVEGQGKHRGCF